MGEMGIVFAVVGMALAAILPGFGSAVGVGMAGQAAAGVLSEEPNLFGKVLVLQLLPGTQGIYGLLIAFIAMINIGILGGSSDMSLYKGLAYFLACMPMAFVGYVSAIAQAKASVASINMVAQRTDQFGKAMVLPAMVETYAILALLISLLAVFGVTGMSI